MANRRKILHHIFNNDLINDKRMRLSAADPNYWLMLKIAKSTFLEQSVTLSINLTSLSHFQDHVQLSKGKRGKKNATCRLIIASAVQKTQLHVFQGCYFCACLEKVQFNKTSPSAILTKHLACICQLFTKLIHFFKSSLAEITTRI